MDLSSPEALVHEIFELDFSTQPDPEDLVDYLKARKWSADDGDDEETLSGLQDYVSESESDDDDSDSNFDSDEDNDTISNIYFDGEDGLQYFTFHWPANEDGFVNITAETIKYHSQSMNPQAFQENRDPSHESPLNSQVPNPPQASA